MGCCINCIHAEWQRTPTGRVSKTVSGRCTWTRTVDVPHSYYLGSKGGPLTLKAQSAIWTDQGQGCATFEAPE